MILGGIVLYYINPTQYWFMPKCPFKLITGLNCPGCGIQRAIHALLHGRFTEAIKYNYFLIYSLPYATLFVVEWMMPRNNIREQVCCLFLCVIIFYMVGRQECFKYMSNGDK